MSNYSLQDVTNMMNTVNDLARNFSDNDLASHLTQLDKRKNILKQTCTSDNSQLKLDRINYTYDVLRNEYKNFDTNNSLEKKFNLFKKLDQLHNDVLSLEDELSKE